jgi:hypothetical protein
MLGVLPPSDLANIGVGASLSPQDVLRFATDHGFSHLCQKDGFNFDRQLESAKALIANPESYFQFPVTAILKPSMMDETNEKKLICMDQKFDSSQQKRALLDSITKYLEGQSLSQTLLEDVIAVADELITNAIFNAPFIDTRTNANPGLNRMDTEIKLKSGKFGRLILAHDENELVIGCEDPYGSLNLDHYLNKIRTTYLRGPAATMNFGSGGAGLGSYIIFNAGSSLYFGVKASKVTLLCCSIPLKMSYKKRVQLPKHLHVIQL